MNVIWKVGCMMDRWMVGSMDERIDGQIDTESIYLSFPPNRMYESNLG